MCFERLAGRLENLVEDTAQREHGGSCVHAPPGNQDLAHLAAGSRGPLEQDHVESLAGKLQGRHQSGNAGADDGDARAAQIKSPG